MKAGGEILPLSLVLGLRANLARSLCIWKYTIVILLGRNQIGICHYAETSEIQVYASY